jgi:hypothetical protein
MRGLDSSEPGQGQEHGNEPSGSIKGGKFLDQLSNSEVPKKDSAPWSQLQV